MKRVEFAEDYFVDESGRVFSSRKFKQPTEIVGTMSKKGYLYVRYVVDGKTKTKAIHRLVAENFILNPNRLPQVNHMDTIKINNDKSNLEWCTNSHNQQHAWDNGLQKNTQGRKNARKKSRLLSFEDAHEICRIFIFRDKQFGAVPLGKKYGVSGGVIRGIVSGRTYNEA